MKNIYQRLIAILMLCMVIVNDFATAERIQPILESEEEEALRWLLAGLPTPDAASHPESFFADNVRTSLRARREMPWGSRVPEREFRHFVLPLRVNNEALDSFRIALYDELSRRVDGMSMTEAALEVNHWCHEKVSYRPSDGRTSPPLSTIRQASGRCGEESTLLVAALRTIGIPARQVYTPRWAHTDDNHAWVEAWTDGCWHFMGACEPEPIVDLGWFNAPASRGMLMTSNVFGQYKGDEEQLLADSISTRINVTPNYAPTAPLRVMVRDADGLPVANADVRFGIYNYSEFSEVARRLSSRSGLTSIIAGLGDMTIWATDGRRYGFATGRSGIDPLEITLLSPAENAGVREFDIVPPSPGGFIPYVSPEERAINDWRLSHEDSIRHAYEATFLSLEAASALLDSLPAASSLPAATRNLLVESLMLSRGNHPALTDFLRSLRASDFGRETLLLNSIAEKDLRDVSIEVLRDAIEEIADPEGELPEMIFGEALLNPRVEWEPLTPSRSMLRQILGPQRISSIRRNPQSLPAIIDLLVSEDTIGNPADIPQSPEASIKSGRATRSGRNILLIAAARAAGIAARLNPIDAHPEHYSTSAGWQPFEIGGNDSKSCTGELQLTYTPTATLPDPAYYNTFTLARIEDGLPRTLEFPDESTFNSLFTTPMTLDAGEYMLVSGQRLADGRVLGRSVIFEIAPDAATEIELIVRHDDTTPEVIGNLDAELTYYDLASKSKKSILSTTGRGYYILSIVRSGHEPSSHLLNEIAAVQAEFDTIARPMLLLFRSREEAGKYLATAAQQSGGQLPQCVSMGVDENGQIERSLRESMHLQSEDLPLTVIADTFNRVVDLTTGYTISAAPRLLQLLRILK